MAKTKKGVRDGRGRGKSNRTKSKSSSSDPFIPAADRDPESNPPVPSVSPVDEAGASEIAEPEAAEAGVEQNVAELLSFRLADEEYAVDLLKVKEIIRLTEITYVPRAPQFIEGIISLRGTVIPIFDLRGRIGLQKRPPTRKSRIIIAKAEGGLIGFIADEVTDVTKVPVDEIEAAPGAKEETEHLIGVLHFKEKMVIYMDIDQAMGRKPVL
jgi:purine-binding chemotaxis protein CheW